MLNQFEKYLKNEKRRSPRTVASYHQNIKTFRKYIKRDYLMVTDGDMRTFKRHLVFKKLKSTSINQVLSSIKTFYDWLVLEQRITKNPVKSDLFFKTEIPGIIEIPTSDEISKMIGAVQYKMDQRMLKRQMRKDLRRQRLMDKVIAREEKVFYDASQNVKLLTLRDKFLISALASSGLRIAEMLKLTTDDIGENGSIRVRQGKGNRDRVSFIDKRSRRIYKEYSAMLAERNLKKIFRLTYRQAWHRIKGYCIKAGIKKNIKPHSFRHYFCTTMGVRGMSDTDLSKFSGHRNLATLARYKNYSIETQKKIYEKYQDNENIDKEKNK